MGVCFAHVATCLVQILTVFCVLNGGAEMQIRTCTWHHVVERSAHVANRLAQVLIAHCVPNGGAESANQNLYLAATGEGFCTCGHTPGPGARRVLLCMSPNTHAPCTRLEPFGEKWLSVKNNCFGALWYWCSLWDPRLSFLIFSGGGYF